MSKRLLSRFLYSIAGIFLTVILTWIFSSAQSFQSFSSPMILAPKPEEATFSSGKLLLHGFIHKPQGDGPFPAIVMNHGSEQFPKSGDKMAKPFVSKGYTAVFKYMGDT